MHIESIKRSLAPVWQAHKTECVALTIAIICTLISLGVFIAPALQPSNNTVLDIKQPANQSSRSSIMVHIDGAVGKPGVYEVQEGSRVQDLISRAQGLREDADRTHIAQQLNLSKHLTDEEKIYIPFQTESDNPPIATPQDTLISLNTASAGELDALPGIGSVTAKKIIAARPYSNPDELVTQKIVSSSVYQKIKDLIRL